MVYTTQRFKIIPNPQEQPISIGEENIPNPPLQNPLDALINLISGGGYPPIQFPTPSTSPIGGTIDEPPSPTTCPAGYAINNNNQCVLIPIGTGVGDITEIQVPNTATAGGNIIIKSWFKNTHTQTLEYKIIITISALNMVITSPALSVAPGQTSMIESIITIPAGTPTGTYSGTVQLIALVPGTNGVVLQESQVFTLGVGTVVTGTASIIPSKTTVAAGGTFSIAFSAFGASEIIDFIAKVGTTTVSTDVKTAGSNGAGTLDTMDISSSAPAGTATITATGRSSGRTATATVAITVTTTPPPTATCPVGPTVFTIIKKGTRRYEVRWSNAGFKQGEKVYVKFYQELPTRSMTSFERIYEPVDGNIDAVEVSIPSNMTCVKVRLEGMTSKKLTYGWFTPT